PRSFAPDPHDDHRARGRISAARDFERAGLRGESFHRRVGSGWTIVVSLVDAAHLPGLLFVVLKPGGAAGLALRGRPIKQDQNGVARWPCAFHDYQQVQIAPAPDWPDRRLTTFAIGLINPPFSLGYHLQLSF